MSPCGNDARDARDAREHERAERTAHTERPHAIVPTRTVHRREAYSHRRADARMRDYAAMPGSGDFEGSAGSPKPL